MRALVAWLLLGALLSAQQPYDQCLKVLKAYYATVQGVEGMATTSGILYINSDFVPLDAIYDPITGLYLFPKKPHPKPLKVLNRYPKEVALYTKDGYKPNKITKEALSLSSLATLQYPSSEQHVVMGQCCTLRGFNTPWGVITSEYINHFLSRPTKTWSSAGITLSAHTQGAKVVDVDPFFAYNAFKVGDIILLHEGKKVQADTLEKSLQFAQLGTIQRFKVSRNNQTIEVAQTLKTKLGGGVIAKTYLEHFGMRFDKNLKIHSILPTSHASTQGLARGDRLRAIDGVYVTSEEEVRRYVSTHKLGEKIELILERAGLQFFVYFPSDIMRLL